MKLYYPGMKEKPDTKEQALAKQLKAAAKGFLLAMKEAREASNAADRKYWLDKAKKFKAYLERLGKNK